LKSLRVSEQLHNNDNIALALFTVGYTYRLQENYTMALPSFFKAEQLFKITNTPNLVNTYNLMGIIYDKREKPTTALNVCGDFFF